MIDSDVKRTVEQVDKLRENHQPVKGIAFVSRGIKVKPNWEKVIRLSPTTWFSFA